MKSRFLYIGFQMLFTSYVFAQISLDNYVKTQFNGLQVGGSNIRPAKSRLNYEHSYIKSSTDSAIYSFDCQDITGVFGVDPKMLIFSDRVYIDFGNNHMLQKLMDFGLEKNEQWNADYLFCYRKSWITFESKYYDTFSQDTIYSFSISGQGICSHTDPVKRIYGSRRLGLIRIDFGNSIFVSEAYVKRNRLKHYYSRYQTKGNQ